MICQRTSLIIPSRSLTLSRPPDLDSGRGGAEVWTTGSLDREEYRRLDVQVWLADAGGMSTTEVLTVVVDDINDNLMRPASKNVYLCKPRVSGSLFGFFMNGG